MPDSGKRNVLGVQVDAIDYEAAVARILAAAEERQGFSVSALAVHGVMTGVLDATHRYRLNRLDLVVPDGQPVRWALNMLHGARLRDRVYGPELMLRVVREAAERGLPIYLYGSRREVLNDLSKALTAGFPGLVIAGTRPSRFRRLDAAEKRAVVEEIRASGAAITFVGLGCPRQEVWAYEYRDALRMPILAVGAAFDFHAGSLPQAPNRLQRAGLEWLFRLVQEPRRLWRRYLLLNPMFVWLILLQSLGLRDFSQSSGHVPEEELSFG
jgi:N-acetylglucosaminyldiphosphoundecaprenol N-acetyl-beta-D-mannosaminyltransferase